MRKVMEPGTASRLKVRSKPTISFANIVNWLIELVLRPPLIGTTSGSSSRLLGHGTTLGCYAHHDLHLDGSCEYASPNG